jgi:aminoglycoside phosphotransferase (APT) family kinase protein
MTARTPAMTGGRPKAEVEIDAGLARRLLRAQHPDLADRPIRPAASGWDNVLFRLGDDLALRLPRRAVAAVLIENEQRWLPTLKDRLPLAIPAPVRIGVPGEGYPWAWSVTPWFEGRTADVEPPGPEQGEVLAAFFEALHRPAPEDAPRNPYRGVPLSARIESFEARAASLAERGRPLDPRIRALWEAALAAPDDAEPTWIQGDPHPRNVLVRDGRLTAVIDWGDLARGDRASDLAGVWMLLPDRIARERAVAACASVTAATWARARGWAAAYGAILLDVGLADGSDYAAIGAGIFQRLIDGP